jgi:hypothetical protein
VGAASMQPRSLALGRHQWLPDEATEQITQGVNLSSLHPEHSPRVQ